MIQKRGLYEEDNVNKKRKGQALALMLVSILAVSHLQAVDASTVNKAKNKNMKRKETQKK